MIAQTRCHKNCIKAKVKFTDTGLSSREEEEEYQRYHYICYQWLS